MTEYVNNSTNVSHRLCRQVCRRVFAAVACLALLVHVEGCGTAPPGQSAATDFSQAPAAAPAADQALVEEGGGQTARDIEEADIVKIVGDKLYALNQYKGLLIVDVGNPDAPALLGQLELRGRGVEMYVLDQRVYVVLSADWYYYVEAGGAVAAGDSSASRALPPPPEFQGSQLAIIDVSTPSQPASMSKLNLAGYAEQSRRVGDVIYIVGTNYIPFGARSDAEEELDEGFVASVNVADPDNTQAVERQTFPGSGMMIHVSESTLFAASHQWNAQSAEGFTQVQVVDISDPAGHVAVRGAFDVPGRILNRFFMDDYEDVFRVVTESWGFGFAAARLYTYDLSDLDHVVALGQADIIENESVRAVSFDGLKGYAVTYFQVDPLFVLDLSDPAHPAVTGRLEVPGFSTHLEPRGDRLIAIGIDDTDGRRPAVAYYNVADPAHPTQLGRVVLGPPGSFTESEAVYDEKAFKVVDELALIAVPFQHVDFGAAGSAEYQAPVCKNAVQLVDFSDQALVQRGWFEHQGKVQRVGVIGERVFALSQVSFQTVDISDRDNPAEAAQIAFFTDEEMANWDGCWDWGWWPSGPVDPAWNVVNGGWCGMLGMAPMGLLACGLWVLRPIGSIRRR
jgi:hypothetical protein